jgi:F-type H+-transporting ATPase subunit a
MNGLELITDKQWSVGYLFNSQHPFFTVSAHTVTNTWIVLGMILLLALATRWVLAQNGIPRYLYLSFTRFFLDLYNQSFTSFSMTHFSFIASLFVFIFLCNIISVIPWTEEPTTDLNTTLALGIIAFIYTQIAGIKAEGLWSYIKSYFSPFFIMMPLNVVGKLASIVSISFRLFGNIFGGAIISKLWIQKAISGSLLLELFGILSGINLGLTLFFGVFEGFLQAFVFTMLTLTYLSLAVQGEGGH